MEMSHTKMVITLLARYLWIPKFTIKSRTRVVPPPVPPQLATLTPHNSATGSPLIRLQLSDLRLEPAASVSVSVSSKIEI